MVDLPSHKHFEDSYYWGLVEVEREVDLASAEIVTRVENFDFVEEIVVEGMVMTIVDLDLEVGELADSERIEDIDRIGQISHKDFAFACFATMLGKDFVVVTKVVSKDSNLVGAGNS